MDIKLEKINDHSYEIYYQYMSNRKHLGKAVMDVDGYYYYWPCDKLSGSWSSHNLKQIADILVSLNIEHEETIKKSLS